MVNGVLVWGGGAGVAVGAGVGEQCVDGTWCVAGDGGPDGDLVLVVPVEGLDVEGGQEGGFDPVGGVGEGGGGDGELVQQLRVVLRHGRGQEGLELGFGSGPFVVQFGVAGPDAGAHTLNEGLTYRCLANLFGSRRKRPAPSS